MQTTKSHSLAARDGLALSFLMALVLVAPSCAKRDLRPLNPCTVSASSEELNVLPAEDIDLLFVVDNSGSMAEEQAALADQIGTIIRTLIDQTEIDLLAANNEELQGAKAVKRLRVGTISTDFGVAGFGQNETPSSINALDPLERFTVVIPNCGVKFDEVTATDVDAERTRTGDRGVINLTPVSATLGSIMCPASYPSFLAFDVEGTQSVVDFVDDVACTTVLGTSGCGFEFQLEAMLAAVTPSDSTAVSFATVHDAAAGVADVPYPNGNAGFFREEAILAVIMITDEDDCSTSNTELFRRSSTILQDPSAPILAASGNPFRFNTRCTHFDDELYPIQRYVDGLLAAKPANKLIFAGIVGVPGDAVDPDAQRNGEAGEGFDTILGHSDMQVTDYVTSGEWATIPGQPPGDSVTPACWRCIDNGTGDEDPGVTTLQTCPATTSAMSSHDLQYAVPARRIVEVARGLRVRGVISVIETICAADFSGAVENILVAIISQTKPSCLRRALNPDSTGAVPCNFLERLPEGMSCADLEGREETPFKVDAGRETCRLIQRIPTEQDIAAGETPEGLGWFYDTYTEVAVSTCAGREQVAMVRFTDGTVPTSGATLRIDCLQPTQAEKDINSVCGLDADCQFDDDDQLSAFVVRWNLQGNYMVGGNQPMACENETNTCQIGCGTDADCPGGMVCDTSRAQAPSAGFCVDPTCTVN
jgi:hypothetical protein